MLVRERQKRVQDLISDGERRLKIFSSMEINMVARSPYIDNVLQFLKMEPDYYNQASKLIDSQQDNLGKIMKSIEYLKILDGSRAKAGR